MSTALLPVPGKDTCPALEVLVNPCHLSMYEDLGDSLGNLHFMKEVSTQKSKCSIHRTIKETKKKRGGKEKSDRYYHSEFQKWVNYVQKNWQRALTYAKFTKKILNANKDEKTISGSLNTG